MLRGSGTARLISTNNLALAQLSGRRGANAVQKAGEP
jgi:hypothetical protein